MIIATVFLLTNYRLFLIKFLGSYQKFVLIKFNNVTIGLIFLCEMLKQLSEIKGQK